MGSPEGRSAEMWKCRRVGYFKGSGKRERVIRIVIVAIAGRARFRGMMMRKKRPFMQCC
jgi:hypothetical protein